MKRKTYDPLLRTQPWKIFAVFEPLESVLGRLELDGTVDTAGRQVIFKESSRGQWYDLPGALRGVIEFHKLAQEKYGIAADFAAISRFANKLEHGTPIFEKDIADIRACIHSCKRQAMCLRVSQAEALVNTVRLSAEVDRLQLRAA